MSGLPPGFVLDGAPAAPAPGRPPASIPGRPRAVAPPTPFQVEDQEMQRAAARRAEEEAARARRTYEATHDPVTGAPLPKPSEAQPTESERTAGFLTQRIVDATGRLSGAVKRDPSASSPTLGVELTRSVFGDTAANYLTDPERQQVRAAQIDIIDAGLTLGTGAAYTKEQLEGYREVYFPKLGDSEATIASKREALRSLLTAARIKAGRSAPEIDAALSALGLADGQPAQGGDQGAPVAAGGVASTGGGSAPGGGVTFRPDGSVSFGKDNFKGDYVPGTGGAPRLQAAGDETYSTANDLAYAADLQAAYEKGATVPQMLQIARQYGFKPELQNVEQWQAAVDFRDKGDASGRRGFAGVDVPQSGRMGLIEQGMNTVAKTGPGTAAIAAGDVASFGTLDELVGASRSFANGTDYQSERDYADYAKRAAMEERPGWAVAGTVAGSIAPAAAVERAGMAGLQKAAPAVANWVRGSNVARSAGTNALLAGAYGAGSENENRLAGAATGAVIGGVLGAGAERGLNALAARPRPARMIEGASDIVATGEREGVNVLTSDIRPPSTATGRLARTITERIPLAGTGGRRATQQVQREAAVANFVEEFGSADGAIDAVSADLAATRGKMIEGLTKAKTSVIESVDGAVPTPNTVRTIDEQIARLSGIDADAFAPVISRLNGFKKALTSGKNLQQIEGQRRLLGDLFQDPNLANIKGDGQKAVNALYNPLREDMGAFIREQAGPAAFNRWSTANQRLSAMMDDLQSTQFKSLLSKAETTPEAAASIIFGKKPSDMKRLYASLSDAGKNKVEAAIIHRAASGATDSATQTISPQKFANAMRAVDDATRIFMSPEKKARLDGLVRLIEVTQRASEAAASPMTGAQNTPLIAGYGIHQIAGNASIPISGLIGALANGYESQMVRNLYLRLGRTQPGSNAERAVTRRIVDTLSRSGILQAAQNDNVRGLTGVLSQSPGRAAAQDEPNGRRIPPQ